MLVTAVGNFVVCSDLYAACFTVHLTTPGQIRSFLWLFCPIHLPATTKHFDRAYQLPVSSRSSLLHRGSITSHLLGEVTTLFPGRDPDNEFGGTSVAFIHLKKQRLNMSEQLKLYLCRNSQTNYIFKLLVMVWGKF